jgi:glyoxylase-like metal-dependent hydrolase (beta-lactamase superfamily II)
MIEAADLQHLRDSLWLWQAFDPAVKSDLFSTATKIQDRLFLVDPIPLAASALAEMAPAASASAVLVTNANHPRAAVALARQLDAPIFAAEPVIGEFGVARTRAITACKVAPGVEAIAIAGAATGEMAFHFADDGGTMVIGDALINFEPYGFALLPPKYCFNQKEMRRSLRQLLDWPFDRLLFAHGPPILSSARKRLETRLHDNR